MSSPDPYALRLAFVASITFVLVTLGRVPEATAKPRTYGVEIDTEPAGAMIYLDDADGDRLGKTPYRGKLEPGVYTIFLKRDGFEPTYQTLEVRKQGRLQEFFFELKKVVYGQVKVTAGESDEDIDGARILIDGEEVGNAPDTIKDVAVGPHQVEVIKEGFEVFEAWIEVESKKTSVVEVALEASEGGSSGGDVEDDSEDDAGDEDEEAEDDEEADEDGEEDDDDSGKGTIGTGVTPVVGRTMPFVVLAVGPEFGNRSFQYTVPAGVTGAPKVRPYEAVFVPLLRIRAQVYPLAASPNKLLAGWGFSASYAQAATVTSQTADMQTLETTWSEWDANARFMYNFASAHVAGELGFAGQSFGFQMGPNATDTLLDEVPGVDYRFTRFGVEAGVRFAKRFGLAAGFHYRSVSTLGALGTKFAKTQVTAWGGNAMFTAAITPAVQVQLIGTLSQYNHVFTVASTQNPAPLVAGADRFLGVMAGVAYTK